MSTSIIDSNIDFTSITIHDLQWTLLLCRLVSILSECWTCVCACSQVCSFINGASVNWIPEQKVPYATNGVVWVGYDNVQSFAAKVTKLQRHWSIIYVAPSLVYCSDKACPKDGSDIQVVPHGLRSHIYTCITFLLQHFTPLYKSGLERFSRIETARPRVYSSICFTPHCNNRVTQIR